MSTTVEISDDAHSRLKKARDLIYEKYRIQMRMPDLMEHIICDPNDLMNSVMDSINKVGSKKE